RTKRPLRPAPQGPGLVVKIGLAVLVRRDVARSDGVAVVQLRLQGVARHFDRVALVANRHLVVFLLLLLALFFLARFLFLGFLLSPLLLRRFLLRRFLLCRFLFRRFLFLFLFLLIVVGLLVVVPVPALAVLGHRVERCKHRRQRQARDDMRADGKL